MDYFNSFCNYSMATEALAEYDNVGYTDMAAMEGFNSDINNVFKPLRSELARLSSIVESQVCDEKYTEACDTIREMISLTEKAKNEMKNMPVDAFRHVRRVASFIIPVIALALLLKSGKLVSTIMNALKIPVNAVTANVGVFAVGVSRGTGFNMMLRSVISGINGVLEKKELKEEYADDKNMANKKYRDYIYQIETAIKAYKQLIVQIQTLAAEQKK